LQITHTTILNRINIIAETTTRNTKIQKKLFLFLYTAVEKFTLYFNHVKNTCEIFPRKKLLQAGYKTLAARSLQSLSGWLQTLAARSQQFGIDDDNSVSKNV